MKIADELKQSHIEILEAIEGMKPDEMTRENTIGLWSVRDVILHIAMWEGEAIKAMAVWRTGHDYDWSYVRDIQMFNEFFIDAGGDLQVGQVLKMFNLTHSPLVADVAALPTRSGKTGVSRNGYKRLPSSIIKNILKR